MRDVRPALVLPLLFLCLTGRALGTTFVTMNEEDLVRRSVAVVLGTVTRIESALDRANDGVNTYVHLRVTRVLLGDLEPGGLVLRERGGTVGERSEWIYGSPEYAVGEKVLVFLAAEPDGALRTTALAMGRYSVLVDSAGRVALERRLGEGAAVYERSTGRLVTDPEPERRDFEDFVRGLGKLAGKRLLQRSAAVRRVPSELAALLTEERESYTLRGTPSRWFEPDSGQAVAYRVDETGDSALGPASSRAAAASALAAWSNVPTSALLLVDGGTTAPQAFSGCGGPNRIVFNDPFNEVTNPSGCSGVLALGGFCTNGSTTVVNGTTFRRIVVGKVTFADGWSGCSAWTQCNVAEVATHELGHTIGLGHSTVNSATMRGSAHFDGRCAGLAADDAAAVTFVYPIGGEPGPTSTATVPPTATPTRTATDTPDPANPPPPTQTPGEVLPTSTLAPASTPVPTSTRTATNVPSATRTRTRTPTRTLAPTLTPTSAPTDTASPTATATPAFACAPEPVESECRVSGKSLFKIQKGSDGGDAFLWKWLQGDAPIGDFGVPSEADVEYGLCLYRESKAGVQLVGSAMAVEEGGVCTLLKCWKQLGRSVPKGFSFAEKEDVESGIVSMLLMGGKPGRDKIVVEGEGSYLPLVAPSDAEERLVIQLVNDAGGCWESSYGPGNVKVSTGRFQARGSSVSAPVRRAESAAPMGVASRSDSLPGSAPVRGQR
jgi:hypothetical protein